MTPVASVQTPDGVRIAVHRLSHGSRPLLLAHATGFHGRVWDPVAGALGGRFGCLAPDLRGHGDSPAAPDEDFDWHGFAADLLAVIDGCGLEPPLLGAGHSSGATGLLLAEQARPGTFGALYCFEPIIVPADPPLGRDPDNWLAVSSRRRRARFASRREALAHYSSRPPFSELDPGALQAYVTHGLKDAGGGVELKCDPRHEALVYEMASAHDCFQGLERVACPVTLARGGRSETMPAARQAALADRLPRVSCQVHETLGHLGPLENPVAIAEGIARAL